MSSRNRTDADPTEVAPAEDQPAAATATPAVESAEPTVESDEPGDQPSLVRARWTGAPAFNPEQGFIDYGGEILVTPEQLADPATLATDWDEGWQPDPVMVAMFADPTEEG